MRKEAQVAVTQNNNKEQVNEAQQSGGRSSFDMEKQVDKIINLIVTLITTFLPSSTLENKLNNILQSVRLGGVNGGEGLYNFL